MLPELRERVGDPERLRAIVRSALAEPGAEPLSWDATPLQDAFGAGQRSLWLVDGSARVGAAERDWSAVLKVVAPIPDQRADQVTYWKREALLYASGALDDLPPGLRAPRAYGVDEQPDGSVWVFLERVREDGDPRWPIGRWALAARHLGRFNGAYAAGRPLPSAPWLGGARLRSWLERHVPLVERIAAAPDDPRVAPWWPRPVVDAVLRLWQERERFCDALERLPSMFGHGDAIRRNLFAARGPDGAEETLAIDWEHAGYYALGEDVGQTLSVAAAFFDLEPDELPALDEALFAGYLDGLHDAGWRGDPRPVRFAMAAHAALRNGFNAVGSTVPDEAGRARALQNFGRTVDELAERRAAIRPFLLALADEARELMV